MVCFLLNALDRVVDVAVPFVTRMNLVIGIVEDPIKGEGIAESGGIEVNQD